MEYSADENVEIKDGKKIRRRKKQLYSDIKEKMEFYFSDANLRKDRFLAQLLQESNTIDINVFLKFNQIKKLTVNVEDVAKALRKSEMLKVTEEGTKVFRTTEIKEKLNEDECTVYVEQLPPDGNHQWLNEIFSKYGKVEYISIPKYKSGKIKGFAFVEFDSPDSVKKALEAFTEAGCCLTSQMNPENLCSISTHDEKEKIDQPEEMEMKETQETVEDKSKKRRKSDDEEKSEDNRKKLKLEEAEPSEEVESEEVKSDENPSEDQIGKKKKNRKKKKSKKQKYTLEVESYGLHILPKVEWKRLRNKYLNLQRQNMSVLKQQLYRSRNQNQSRQPPERKIQKKEKAPKFSFSPGLIVKVTFDQPLTDRNKFKAEARCIENVAYIDVQEGELEAHIRLENAKTAEDIVSSPSRPWEYMSVLTGEEEKKYWDKVMRDREEKVVKKVNVKKTNKRGKTKLMNQAEKLLSKKIRLSVDE